MIRNPDTLKLNVTDEEVEDARHATEDVPLVREDGTLTTAGRLYVGQQRAERANVLELESEIAKWIPNYPDLEDEAAIHLADVLTEWARR